MIFQKNDIDGILSEKLKNIKSLQIYLEIVPVPEYIAKYMI
jgi:hypothetical protein